MPRGEYDAVVVGTGPNGLAAAVRLAQAGLSVLVLEQARTIGGGLRSTELTLPGLIHDTCSAVHPFAIASPFLAGLPLNDHGLEWVHPPAALAHPLRGGEAVLLHRDVTETARGLGADEGSYLRLMEPLLRAWPRLAPALLRPMLRWPANPGLMMEFAQQAVRSAQGLVRKHFRGPAAAALFAGLAAHSFLRLNQAGTAAFGLLLGVSGHAHGWPMPRGGAQRLADALVSLLKRLGGEIVTGVRVSRLEQLPPAGIVMLDLTPKAFVEIAGKRLGLVQRGRYGRFPRGPGVFKLDYALAAPIPWTAHDCARAGVVHLGGAFEEIAASEHEVSCGREPKRPFVLLAQPTLFDATRSRQGQHVAWAYCHVPNGSDFDMAMRIEEQIERFAPGFRDCILARRSWNCADMEASNPNYLGGDISGGPNTLRWLLFRPVARRCPYRTPLPGVYLCSASTPPGGGVHGMCGFHAAEAALFDQRSKTRLRDESA